MPVFRYKYGEGELLDESILGCEAANARKDSPEDGPFTECCIRMCWSDDCVSDWDLWVRERTEPGTGPGSSTKWVSYLNLGPVGETGMEMHADTGKEGEEGNEICDDDPNTCGVSAGTNGWSGEIVCFCLADSMSYPKTFDIVVNLFGADQLTCPDPLGTVCIEYSCCDETFCGVTEVNSISGVFDFQGKGTSGNEGAGDFPQPTIIADSRLCDDKYIGTTSTCWVLRGTGKDGKPFVNRGGGRAPSRFLIPDDVDPESCVLVEDGIKIPRRHYMLMHDSVAEREGVPRTAMAKGIKYCGNKKKGKKKPCRGRCKKRKKKSLF